MANSTGIGPLIEKRLLKRRLFYVCRDIERAFGHGVILKNYYIITNKNSFSTKLAKEHDNIILIRNKRPLDTVELLDRPETKIIIKPEDFVLVFKNNTIIETICKKNNWNLLNPDSKLADTIESKISQIDWLGNLADYLPTYKIDSCENISWVAKKFILQFNHSHTGSGTFLIDSKIKLQALQKKFPKRPVRIMEYIDGPVFTNNNIIWGSEILLGNISYQITGLPPFTNNVFTTIGNDWVLAGQLLRTEHIKQYTQIVTDVGKRLQKNGWKGLFGVDIIMDKKTGRLYLLEINARQPASTTFESELQKLETGNSKLEISTFEAHVAAVLDIEPTNFKLIEMRAGSQIIQRITRTISKIGKLAISNPAILHVIKYNNTALGSDLLRIQCNQGIMKAPGILNTLGKTIRSSVC